MTSADQATESETAIIEGASKRKITMVPTVLITIPERSPLKSRTGRAVSPRVRINAWASMSGSFS